MIVAVGRPYPPTGLTTALWLALPVRLVRLDALTTTQRHLYIDALLTPEPSDHACHVVQHEGHLWLEDGRHRATRAALRGATHVPARIHHADALTLQSPGLTAR